MKIRVADLLDGPLDLSGKLDPEPYDLKILGSEVWSPLEYEFHVERVQDELLVRGHITSTVKMDCARCQEPLPVSVAIPDFACALPITTQESIDLTLSIREDILLSLPMAASCHLDANGRCPHTGVQYKPSVDTFAEQRRSDIWGPLKGFKEGE